MNYTLYDPRPEVDPLLTVLDAGLGWLSWFTLAVALVVLVDHVARRKGWWGR